MQTSHRSHGMVPGSHFFFGALVFALVVLTLLFALYIEFLDQALLRIGIPNSLSLPILGAIIIGGFVNVPLHRDRYPRPQLVQWLTYYRNWGEEPFPLRSMQTNTIAINVGGALVPMALGIWLVVRMTSQATVLVPLAFASLANALLCHRIARVVPNVGILLPGWVAPVVGVGLAWALLPPSSDFHTHFAFVTAIAGPFIGADLMNLKDVTRMGVGTMSIGGAGPLDGILMSGMLAALFA